MQPARITVLLPCHSLEDFPSWIDGEEARDLLDAWTAAWHPSLLAATAQIPAWASLEFQPADPEASVFLLPAAFDDRLSATGLDAMATARVVRQRQGRRAIAEAAVAEIAQDGPPAGSPAAEVTADVADDVADDFHALGLAWLLSELLARRMRSSLSIDPEAFRAAAVAAAIAALEGRDEEKRERLVECFETLSSVRKRYYPVDIWLLDFVLVAGSTLGDALGRELSRPGRRTLIATGELLDRLAGARPDLAAKLREGVAAGRLAGASGLYDDAAVHRLSPEAILDSIRRGREAWEAHSGVLPTTFARRTGGLSAILPQIATAAGFTNAIYQAFDGTRLPDPGSSRIRWEGPSGAAIESVASSSIDARSPNAAMTLAESIGDVLDHSHTAILSFAHYPGTAQPWFDDLRRISEWSDVFGRFVLPEDLFRETAGTGVRADFEPDSFSGPQPVATDFDRVSGPAGPLSRGSRATSAAARPASAGSGLFGSFFAALSKPKDREEAMQLENGLVVLRVHPETGGMLSFRATGGGPNRLSQQLAVRTTSPLAAGGRWEDPLDRALYSRMVADVVERASGPNDEPAIESRGRLIDETTLFGKFRQKVWLEASEPIARFEIEIDLAQPLPPSSVVAEWFNSYAACRFAWNENDDVECFRSLHTQATATERTNVFAEHFIELRGTDCTILTCGLPWHVRSSPHMLDTILLPAGCAGLFPAGSADLLPAGPQKVTRQLAIGLGLDAPWEPALALADPSLVSAARISCSPPARITSLGRGMACGARQQNGIEGVAPHDEPQANEPQANEPQANEPRANGLGPAGTVRFGVLESRGQAGLVRLKADAAIAEAWRIDARGKRDRPLAVDGGEATVELGRYEWAMLEIRPADAAKESPA